MAEPAGFRLTTNRFAAWLPPLLLGVLTLIRLTVAAGTPLAPDEAYYWVFSHALAPGYPDHPPMVALWIRAGTALAGPGELGIRLLGPLAAALESWLLFDAARRMFPQVRGAGLTAAALFNATLLVGGNAIIMTPDAPLLLFWTATLWALAGLLRRGQSAWWLAVGVFAGLDLASKYTALLLWLGIAAWLLWVPALRRWWRSPMTWLGALLGALIFAPVMLWNAQHGWASFLRQGGRVEAWRPEQAPQFLAELIGGQIGLATPLVFLLLAAGGVVAVRRARRDPAWGLLAALILPGVMVFVQHALGDRVQGNWPAIIYPAAAVAAAGLTGRFWQRLRLPAVGLGLGVTAVAYLWAALSLPLLPAGIDPVARLLSGWPGLASAVETARASHGATFVACDEYGVAAELARALPSGDRVVGVDQRWRLFRLPSPDLGEQTGILMRNSGGGTPTGWRSAQSLGELSRLRHGAPVQRYALWLVSGPAADLPMVELPRLPVP